MSPLEARKVEILKALQKHRGNRLRAANELGMELAALTRMIMVDPMFREFKVEPQYKSPEKEKEEMTKEIQVRENQRIEETFNTKSVVMKLEGLMDKVTHKECTTETVNAACNCAARITDILRLHIDLERLKMKGRPV